MNYYRLEYICNDKKITRKAMISSDRKIIEFSVKHNLDYRIEIHEQEIKCVKKGSINVEMVHEVNKSNEVDYIVIQNGCEFHGTSTIETSNIFISFDSIVIEFSTDGELQKEIFNIKGAI